jgi:hypothetical protein
MSLIYPIIIFFVIYFFDDLKFIYNWIIDAIKWTETRTTVEL